MSYNKKHITLCFTILFVFTSFHSCKKKTDPPKMHLNYFGLIPGRYVIYDVQEMSHDVALNPQHDTVNYQLKTYIGPEYIDNLGRTAREFHRYKRPDNSQEWVESDLWTAIIENYKAELIEENQRIIKLVFAPTSDKNWNPNAFNAFEEMDYTYSDIHVPKTLNGITFDSTITVQQEHFTSLIDYRIKHETYATNIGLVSKTFKDLRIANFDSSNVQKGTEIYYKCIGYGFE